MAKYKEHKVLGTRYGSVKWEYLFLHRTEIQSR